MKKAKIKQFKQRVMVSAVALIGLVLLALMFTFTNVGEAILTPQLDAIDLNLLQKEDISVSGVEFIDLFFTSSSLEEMTVQLQMNEIEDGIAYVLRDKEFDEILAQGLLDEFSYPSATLYLDNDVSADLELGYGDGFMTTLNLNYQEPDAASIVRYSLDKKDVKIDIVYLSPGAKANFMFNATSNKVPTLSAMLKNGTAFSDSEFSLNETGENFVFYEFDWQPPTIGAYTVVVTAVVDAGSPEEKSSSKEFIIASGGILYEINEENLPKVKITKKSGDFEVKYQFLKTDEDQPFSLPCGDASLEKATNLLGSKKNTIKAIYTYAGGSKQWKNQEEVPSDFTKLEANKGYLIKTDPAFSAFNLTVTCKTSGSILPPGQLELETLPTLNEGWNLIGVGGFKIVSKDQLELQKTSATKSITEAYEVKVGATESDVQVSEFEPGKVYWVKIE
jgi:hypothetical protein